MPRFTYQIVSGIFVQDDPMADPRQIGALPPRFGLLDDSKDRWTKIQAQIAKLNKGAESGTLYKLFFLGRHGEGFHNVAEAKYGTKAWDDYWAKLEGDGEIVWGPDPELTAIGVGQAEMAHAAWVAEGAFNIPFPDKLYCSPLTRALNTHRITFDGLRPLEGHHTVVVENCREENGVHTCDKRRTRSYIETTFPEFKIEAGLMEDDELWDKDERETKLHAAARASTVLDDIFQENNGTFISITAHGGIINALLSVVGHARYSLYTGGVIPILVKGTAL